MSISFNSFRRKPNIFGEVRAHHFVHILDLLEYGRLYDFINTHKKHHLPIHPEIGIDCYTILYI